MSRYFLLMFFIFEMFIIGANAQMIKTNADTTIVTAYSSLDSIYIFHQLPLSKTASMAASSPYTDAVSFTWWKLNAKTYTQESVIPSTINGNISTVTGLASGGYQVNIKNLVTSANITYTGWILKDTVTSKLNKDTKGYLSFGYYTCKYIDLLDSAKTDLFVYANPADPGNTDTLKNKLHYAWWASPVMDSPLVSADTVTNNQVSFIRITTPPYDDTKFTVKVTNQFGTSVEDNVSLISIRPHAIFDTLGCINYVHNYIKDTVYLSAPFHANFVNKSSANALKFNWYFDNGDTLFNTKDPKTIVYYFSKRIPGQTKDTLSYLIKLIAKSAQLCLDTAKMYLPVATAHLENWYSSANIDSVSIPNVFTPDAVVNTFFRPFTVSVKLFHITIFTRTGKTVYEFLGADQALHDWQGWNGKINNSGSDASPGVYFYVIETTPWDKYGQNLFPKKGIYKGCVYLLR